MVKPVSTIEDALGRKLSAEQVRLEQEAGLRAKDHFRRPEERPFLAEEREKTTILFGGLTWRHHELIKGVLEGCGYRCEILPNPDREAFQLGKENCNNAECNPSFFTVGALIKFLKQKEKEGLSAQQIADQFVHYTVGSCGPCRHGMYESEYRYALQNAGFDGFRVLLFQQSKGLLKQEQEPGFEYTADLGMGALNALILADVLTDMLYQIRPYEVNPGETDRVFEECIDYLSDFVRDRPPYEILESTPKWVARRLARKKQPKNTFNTMGKFREHFWGEKYVEALHECRERINGIEVDRTRVKPLIKVTGEFFAQTTESLGNYNMFAFLEKEGAQAQVEAVGCWITYLLYQAKAHWINRRGLEAPHDKPRWWEPRKRFANYAHFKKRYALLSFAERMYGRLYRRAAERLGGMAHELLPQEELAKRAHSYYHTLARGGEGHLEVGKNIYYNEKKLCHMVLSLKPFGCMPSTLSDGVQSAVTSHHRNMLFVPVETTGDGEVLAHSRAQMALSDAKTIARKEFEKALESTGKDLDSIKDYVTSHPELKKALYPIPHRKGVVGMAANFILHVNDRMDGKLGKAAH